MHPHIHTYTHAHTHTHTHPHPSTHTLTRSHAHTHARTHFPTMLLFRSMKITIPVLFIQFYNSCFKFTIACILNKCLIHVKLLPFNFFHCSFCAVEHGLQVTDLGLMLYDNGATITRTNTCRQHTSKAVTCAMCMHAWLYH